MLTLNRWTTTAFVAAAATASLALTASPALALNPQPLPPRVMPTLIYTNPQTLLPGSLVFLNPQPLPPGVVS